MSRLIVKNLPPYVTQEGLKDHFSQKSGPGGTITDVKVALKRDGTSRRFGFVGYKTNAEAEAARAWFDNTFIHSSKISVAVVEGVKDAPAPRPNKKPRLADNSEGPVAGPSNIKKEVAVKKGNGEDQPHNAQLDEFLQVMQSQTKKGPSWANEKQTSYPTLPSASNEASTSGSATEKRESGEDIGDVQVDEEPAKELSDLDWMRQRMTSQVEEKVFIQDDDDDHDGDAAPALVSAEPVEPFPPKDPVVETLLQTSRLFIRNLVFSCTEDDLRELFRPFGEINQVHIPLDPTSKQPKGMAYVTFAQPSAAVAAYEALDKTSFQGRLLHILAAVNRKGNFVVEEAEGQKKKQSLKDERSAKRKAAAGREFNWSMLYMNSDAVASSIADRMNVSKADILNPDSNEGANPAVKLALAETHIIQETKTYLEEQGVILSAFGDSADGSGRMRRSETTILVKNIPYGTTAEQIREMFEPHGELSHVLVPPAGTIAVVEFVHPDEAAKAFRAVAYRRLGSSIIYLEKGPLGMWQDRGEDGDRGPLTSTGVQPVRIADADQAAAAADGEQEGQEQSIAGGSTLFVKNLSFATTSERLTQVFRHLTSFSFARVQMKPDPKRPGAKLSMGYGFVGFKTPDAARKAMKGMQGYVLDGHALHVKFAGRGAEEETSKDSSLSASKSKTTKMIVKNVPFEATKKDIRELFSAHGQLKSVRVPKKFNSHTRGFAFLDFVTRHEAENAFAALKHTHLLGRHLVLEWAEEHEQDIDALRKKAGVGFGGGAEMPGRKRKLDMDLGGGGGDDVEMND